MNHSDASDEPTTPGKATAVTVQPVENLSRRIEATVPREPADRVRCVHVSGSFYRCNWWSRIGAPRAGLDYDWAGLLTDQIRKSCFFKATVAAERLVLEEVDSVSQYSTSRLRE